MLETYRVRLDVCETLPPKLSSAEAAYPVLKAIYADLDANQEHFVVLALNNKLRVRGFKVISSGSETASLVDMKAVYIAALHLGAVAVIFGHNHPSGDPTPSSEDLTLTRRLKEAGELLNMRVLDHIIIGFDRFFSMSDRGIL